MSPVVDTDLLQVSFNALPFEIALLDATGEIIFANDSWMAFGDANSSAHDVHWVGENYLTVCRQADHPTATAVANGLEELLSADRERFRLEYPCHPPDDQRWFLLDATTATYDDNRYGIVTHIDITTRKQAELQRDRQIEQLETIVNALSHDLRNPLNIVDGYTEQLRTPGTNPSAIEAIQESTDRMIEMVDSILEFARTQRVSSLTQVALADVATNAWAQTPTADASLEVESSRSFVADETLLAQVFENLFCNAVEHGGSSVTIWVGTTEDGIYVEDDGPGIRPAKRTQLQKRDVSHDAKTGFGLEIIRAIAIAHGWSFSITDGRADGTRIEIHDMDYTEGVQANFRR
ncbi:HAMP domain-containing sensor histidine kinase [Halostagnicola sp. A-GB9-2]|uniref:PAS domain-containing sensor histidine kinase n=1 Tax=Halostagnicola sp. A-GB9-2 TaxID=3048066 RepID=UPI0024C02C7C|nr:HAMP domain-containing sensor histidine kinase [Halostagnicola sp. A-GB9-2]MDJ1430608.1 HAMP domain-containing sensor histidine kinase [Halostagnicola sp. A-GB9-2]